jgi:hypothetical protein
MPKVSGAVRIRQPLSGIRQLACSRACLVRGWNSQTVHLSLPWSKPYLYVLRAFIVRHRPLLVLSSPRNRLEHISRVSHFGLSLRPCSTYSPSSSRTSLYQSDQWRAKSELTTSTRNSSIASFLFPLFASYKALKTGDPSQLTPWLMYWVVLSCVLLVESWTEWFLVWYAHTTTL